MRAAVAIGAVLAALAGCGGGEEEPAEPPVAEGEQIIRDWARSVREGDFQRANELFALPAEVSNGTPPVTLANPGEVNAFNRSFPCGAVVEAIQDPAGDELLATFRLVRGSGDRDCPGAVGAGAKVSFLIEDGRIREWFRVSATPPPESQDV